MADNKCRFYGDNILERFHTFFGRIGGLCDSCKNRECSHNPAKIGEEGMDNGYAILMCRNRTMEASSSVEISDSEASGEADSEIKQ